MNRKEKKSDGGAGVPSTIAEIEHARVDRWRAQTLKRLAEIEGNDAYIPAAWLEEVEGRPMAEVITDRIAVERGIGATDPTPDQKIALLTDGDYEGESTRRRNNHEKETVYYAVKFAMGAKCGIVPRKLLHDFVRRFYRAGDVGLTKAITRAVCAAMGPKREPDKGECASRHKCNPAANML